jgi:peptidylprolyl isomerase
MEKVESGKFVCVDYEGRLENGEVFDSSQDSQPLEIQMGGGQIIKGFEDAMMGMALREKKVFTLTPDQAYGQRDEDQVHTFSRSEIPAEMQPQVGDMIGLQTPDGQQIPATIAEADDEKVVVDLNHPLAGKSLTFEIEVVNISDEPTQEMHHGCGSGGCGHDHGDAGGCGGHGHAHGQGGCGCS